MADVIEEKKRELLEGLKRQGIGNLEELADYLGKKAIRTTEKGDPLIANSILGPHWFVTSD